MYPDTLGNTRYGAAFHQFNANAPVMVPGFAHNPASRFRPIECYRSASKRPLRIALTITAKLKTEWQQKLGWRTWSHFWQTCPPVAGRTFVKSV